MRTYQQCFDERNRLRVLRAAQWRTLERLTTRHKPYIDAEEMIYEEEEALVAWTRTDAKIALLNWFLEEEGLGS